MKRIAAAIAACVVLLVACRRAPPPPPVESPPDSTVAVALLYRSPDSLLIDLADGQKGFCKANTVRDDDLLVVDNVERPEWCPLPPARRAAVGYNTYVLEDYRGKPIGTRVRVCAWSNVPMGWRIVERHKDEQRCPLDPDSPFIGRPNVLLIERTR